jgi:hypothetical protein
MEGTRMHTPGMCRGLVVVFPLFLLANCNPPPPPPPQAPRAPTSLRQSEFIAVTQTLQTQGKDFQQALQRQEQELAELRATRGPGARDSCFLPLGGDDTTILA